MKRKVLAVVAGFVVWSVLWFAANAGLSAAGLLPPPGGPVNEPSVLLSLLASSVVASVAAGFTASRLAKVPGHNPALWLGAVLTLVGTFVQAKYWSLMPLWYHASFLLLLMPMCLAGSRMALNRSSEQKSLRPTPLP